MKASDLTGDDLIRALAALANPHRLRIVAALTAGRNYVSQLARDLHMSRPLLQVHLRRLEAANLISATLELSEDGKAMKYYEVTPFSLELTPQSVATAARTVSVDAPPTDDEPPKIPLMDAHAAERLDGTLQPKQRERRRQQLEHLDAIAQRPAMRGGTVAQLALRFRQRDVEAFFTGTRAFEQELQRNGGLAGARCAFDKEDMTARKSA